MPQQQEARQHLREIRKLGHTGGQIAVADFLRKLHSYLPQRFEVRFETPSGREVQVAFAEFTFGVADEPGIRRPDPLFSLVRDQACCSMVRRRREHAPVRPPASALKLALSA